MNEKYKYVWEKSRNLYRVVIDNPTYDKETRKTTHHYVTVGKARERDGEIEFGAKYLVGNNKEVLRHAPDAPEAKRTILCGERLVLDEAARRTGLKGILSSTLGRETAEKVLQLAYYWNCTGDALSDSSVWFEERAFKDLQSPRISELVRDLSEEKCSSFIRKWVRKKAASRKVCYDVTSISTYATGIDIAEYGYNRDRENWLKQINLAMVTDRDTHMPLAFRQLRGSINDASTLVDTLNEFMAYDAKPEGLIMDKGFWSDSNLQHMADNHVKCMMPMPSHLALSKEIIGKRKDEVFENKPYVDANEEATYWCTVYDPRGEGKRAWAHVYYSPKLESERKDRFMRRYYDCRQELIDGKEAEGHRKFHDEYFELSRKGRGGKLHVREKQKMSDILDKASFGYWILYTDFEKDAVKALLTYRDRNFIEVGFDDMKGATDGKRLRVQSSNAVYGRLFIQFCAQILRTELRTMSASLQKETRKYAASPSSILKRVRSLTMVKYGGRYKDQFVAVSKGQRLIFKDLHIDLDARSDGEDVDTGKATETDE